MNPESVEARLRREDEGPGRDGELRYGPSRKAAPHYDYVKNAIVRLREYERTGNTEFLVDAANFALLEYACPSHPDAHFRATDHDESPRAVKA
jgi:hypothetical protein